MSERIDMFQPPLGGPSEREFQDAKRVIEARTEAIDEQSRRTLIRCTSQCATGKGCGALHEIATLEYIQTHWYTHPHGCSGGDYWNKGEGKWKCPSCGHVNRLYASPDIEKLKHHFKSVKDTHDAKGAS